MRCDGATRLVLGLGLLYHVENPAQALRLALIVVGRAEDPLGVGLREATLTCVCRRAGRAAGDCTRGGWGETAQDRGGRALGTVGAPLVVERCAKTTVHLKKKRMDISKLFQIWKVPAAGCPGMIPPGLRRN